MPKPKIAVLGIGSIGKFHAREFHNAGCDVVAILESSDKSAEQKARVLQDDFGITPRSYHDLKRLLAEEELDAVSVCTPPKLHSTHVRECLEAALHVFCEKPFVLDNRHENLQIARELLNLAKQKKKVLAINTQWVSVLPEIAEKIDLSLIKEFSMYMEPPIKGAENMITEAIPHANAMLIRLIDFGSDVQDISFPFASDEEIKIKFRYAECLARCHFKLKETRPREFYFSINGIRFQRESLFKDGEYIGQQLVYDDNGQQKTLNIKDPLSESVKVFVSAIQGRGEPLISSEEILQNIKLQDQIVEAYLNLQG